MKTVKVGGVYEPQTNGDNLLTPDKEIYMTKQWECKNCHFPENFSPKCSLCGEKNPSPEKE